MNILNAFWNTIQRLTYHRIENKFICYLIYSIYYTYQQGWIPQWAVNKAVPSLMLGFLRNGKRKMTEIEDQREEGTRSPSSRR